MYANALGITPLSGPYSFCQRVVLYFRHREVSFERPETSLLARQIWTLQTIKTSQPRWSFLAIMGYG
jgi:hypothetical protein